MKIGDSILSEFKCTSTLALWPSFDNIGWSDLFLLKTHGSIRNGTAGTAKKFGSVKAYIKCHLPEPIRDHGKRMNMCNYRYDI